MGRDEPERTFRDEYDGAVAPTPVVIPDPERVENELENDRIGIALLLVSTEAEAILRNKLIRYFEMHTRSFEEVCGNITYNHWLITHVYPLQSKPWGR